MAPKPIWMQRPYGQKCVGRGADAVKSPTDLSRYTHSVNSAGGLGSRPEASPYMRRAVHGRTGDGDLDATELGAGGLVHHPDRGMQYVAIRYTERLAETGAVRSVGSRGDYQLTGQSSSNMVSKKRAGLAG